MIPPQNTITVSQQSFTIDNVAINVASSIGQWFHK